MLGFSGILMALPGGKVTGYSNYEINIFATALFVLPILYLLILRLKKTNKIKTWADIFWLYKLNWII